MSVVGKKGKSYLAVRRIRKFEDGFDPRTFAAEEAQASKAFLFPKFPKIRINLIIFISNRRSTSRRTRLWRPRTRTGCRSWPQKRPCR